MRLRPVRSLPTKTIQKLNSFRGKEEEKMDDSIDKVIQRQKWVLEYLERMARRGDKDAENLFVGHCGKVLEFLVKEKGEEE